MLSGDAATTAKYAAAFANDVNTVDAAIAQYRTSGPAAEESLVFSLPQELRRDMKAARASS